MNRKVIFDSANFATATYLTKKFNKLDKDISLQAVGVFSLVCLNDGISVSDVQEYFKIPKARTSRLIYILSKISRGRKSGKGLGLIELKLDPKDFRKKLLYLTIKGEKLKNSLLIS